MPKLSMAAALSNLHPAVDLQLLDQIAIKSRTLVGIRIAYAPPRLLGKSRGNRSATTAPYRHDDRQGLSMTIADGSWLGV
jgi:hypothetical protein